MIRRRVWTVLAAGLLLLAAGSAALYFYSTRKPTLDASTAQSLRTSSDALRAGLEPAEVKRYDRAVTMIVAATLDPMETITLAANGTMPTQQGVFLRLKEPFHGKNFDDIIEQADESTSQVRTKLASWKVQSGKYATRYKQYLTSSEATSKVHTVSANLSTVEGPFPGLGENQVKLAIRFENGTDMPLDAIGFVVSLMPKGIDNPWVRQAFSETFPGSIQPGQQASVDVGPILVNVPETYVGDVTLEAQIEITRLQSKGRPSIVTAQWDETDMMAISKLDASIAEIEKVLETVAALPK